MLVFWKHKLVIFSVPKTGTSAIDLILAPHADMALKNPPTLKHMPVYRFNRFMRPLLDAVDMKGLETFAMIREPFDWLGSWYRYRGRPELDGTKNSTGNISFDDFVLEAMKGSPEPFANVGSQSKFLSGGIGPNSVKHLFQYEQMDLACAFLEDRLGHKLDLERINTSPTKELKLKDSTIERFKRKRVEEFVIWENAKR